jgi:adenylylsulfate kinase-like enzyme
MDELKIHIIGKSASGKSSISQLISEILKSHNINCEVIDGVDDLPEDMKQIRENYVENLKHISTKTNVIIQTHKYIENIRIK